MTLASSICEFLGEVAGGWEDRSSPYSLLEIPQGPQVLRRDHKRENLFTLSIGKCDRTQPATKGISCRLSFLKCSAAEPRSSGLILVHD
jgi:hypothetical protein